MTHGSLFSGIGGFELGAKMSEIETIWSCEVDIHKRKILKKNFPSVYQFEDIRLMYKPPYVDILSGGFPCQDASIANVTSKNVWINGKIGIKGKNTGLWSEMWRICRQNRPRYIVFENSPMLILRGFEQVLHDITQGGYVCEWQCLQASQFGYNHKRERLYGIAYSNKVRCKNNTSIFRELQEVFPKQTPRQNPIPVPFKRFNSKSSYESVRMDDGFPFELDTNRIEGCGNAIIPEIAHYLFECIKHYENRSKKI